MIIVQKMPILIRLMKTAMGSVMPVLLGSIATGIRSLISKITVSIRLILAKEIKMMMDGATRVITARLLPIMIKQTQMAMV